jgi:hypothetical protein
VTGRILRIEVRRSAITGITLVLLVAGLAPMLTSTDFFAGRWTQLAVFGRATLTLLVPVALAGGAWLGRRDRRNRVDELFTTAVRPRWQRLAPLAGGFALALTTAYLVVILTGAVLVVPTAGYFPASALLVAAVGVPALVAAGWLGMAAGRAVPRVVTAPVLAVVGFAVVALLPDYLSMAGYDENFEKAQPDPAALLLSPVATAIDDFQVIPAGVSLLQTVWLAAAAATSWLLLAAVRRRTMALAVLPAALGVAVAVPLLPAGGYTGAAVVDPAATELVCDNDGPEVCVRRVHVGTLPDVVGPARRALSLMAAKLPDPPTRAVESQEIVAWARPADAETAARSPADILVFDTPRIGRTGRADLESGYFERSLLYAGWRQQCGDFGVAHLAEELAAAWLTDKPPIAQEDWWSPADEELLSNAYQDLVELPEVEQQQRMAAAREAALDCGDDILPLMTGEVP